MATLSKAVFPGSFDPITNGHIDIARRALEVFDQLVIAVGSNPSKATLFTKDERVSLIEEEFKAESKRVEVKLFSGLLVNFVQELGTNVVVRGLRAISDYDYEAQVALMNKNLSENNVETLFMMTSAKSSYISSSLVKHVAEFQGDVSRLVPDHVATAICSKFSK